ncbi:hypothetical protein DFR58_11129 [Anaerobacterium chartisolvens]|uniref:VCBS repeat-containing protein n=1 Tax=Anaerobacterium chartisolvens TaxID=1297424 RepID=A0A369B6W5_9FIRM|nr:hypothetical protein [Anaerobacterium chartisolvens]RCX16286.1 hypothetical protein DFR58_11129 [Anaerobacterium chartisolvens]
MKIASSGISMTGQSALVEVNSKEETLRAWIGNERPDFEGQKSAAPPPQQPQTDTLELSQAGKAFMEEHKASITEADTGKDILFAISDKDMQKLRLIHDMVKLLTGKRLKFYLPVKIKAPSGNELPPDLRGGGVRLSPLQGWGLEYSYNEFNYEKEKMDFSAQGAIKTADGREINFSVQLSMSREFMSQKSISIRAGDAARVDPLIINLNNNAPSLTDTKFSFDLDCNGKPDQISFLSSGSGFLALDINNDGIINDGSELFGPSSGNGFSELSKYDSDNNNWIDENDDIYDRLRIWTKDENGNDILFALGEKGIGAIYLGNIDTDFSIKSASSNELQGQIRKTGIYVNESGSVGTIQHIDLAI